MNEQARRLSNFTQENQASLLSEQQTKLSEQIQQFKVVSRQRSRRGVPNSAELLPQEQEPTHPNMNCVSNGVKMHLEASHSTSSHDYLDETKPEAQTVTVVKNETRR